MMMDIPADHRSNTAAPVLVWGFPPRLHASRCSRLASNIVSALFSECAGVFAQPLAIKTTTNMKRAASR
jgi:hypothetical protein